MLKIPRGPGQSPGAALEQFSLLSSDGEAAGTDQSLMNSDTPKPTVNLAPFPQILHSKLQFSYGGVVSHVSRLLESSPRPAQHVKIEIARAFQAAAVAQLEEKLSLGLRWCENKQIEPTGVVVSGGVASNTFLRIR